MLSIFSKIFSYRAVEGRTTLENYLTEIFTFCLEADLRFRNDFFNKVLTLPLKDEQLNITSQSSYHAYGRPDIEITYNGTAILFECKVDAVERKNQLNHYSKILIEIKKSCTNKHLVYLSKYYELKHVETNDVKLHTIRWFQIHNIINSSHSEITQHLKTFLKEKGMEAVKNFTVQDILAMKTIPETISKMDEILDQFKPVFEKKFGGISKSSSRSTSLLYSSYSNYVVLSYEGKEYSLYVGFFWWWEETSEFPYVGLLFRIPEKPFENNQLVKILDEQLSEKHEWEKEDWETEYYYTSVKPISEFMSDEQDHFPIIKAFINEQLETLYAIQEEHPALFKK